MTIHDLCFNLSKTRRKIRVEELTLLQIYRILAQPPGPIRLGLSNSSLLDEIQAMAKHLTGKATVELGKGIELGKFPFHKFQPKKMYLPITTESIGFLNHASKGFSLAVGT